MMNEDAIMRRFEQHQAEMYRKGQYVNHCDGCAAEDCACCQYNDTQQE